MHPVVLGPARADDDDRRADPVGAGGLDQLPAVEAGEHEIEHDHVRPLEPEPRERDLLAVVHDDRVEPRGGQVRAIPCAITWSSSTMSTFAIGPGLDAMRAGPRGSAR